ncbi:hypothetical protein BpHYR1_016728 [Brachionus plicatilis]|uniref:Uncharacterized protein n=1 Tax=Brachionus plicatilis TaxID=10195 RepID=A0A3M7QK43_BRAPC|nr:hypothetical protein BpHYR1_016728 [Brachionus plicatilis]
MINNYKYRKNTIYKKFNGIYVIIWSDNQNCSWSLKPLNWSLAPNKSCFGTCDVFIHQLKNSRNIMTCFQAFLNSKNFTLTPEQCRAVKSPHFSPHA